MLSVMISLCSIYRSDVGYKNGLDINKDIASKEKWTIQDIIDRTDKLAAELLEVYSLS